jgi:hypothetical protein
VDIALCIHTEVDIGIFGMGFARTSGADFKNQCGRLAAVLQVMAITLTGFEAGAIASVEHGIASIGDEHDRAPDDIDKLVLVSVPMALTGGAPIVLMSAMPALPALRAAAPAARESTNV